tara:strand:- start:245 stop:1156 length:912 start_codon:yes stop_codon:yes gene_type:complete
MPTRYEVKVEKIITESDDSKSYVFNPISNDEGLYDYLPGQFFMLESEITRPETIVYDKESKSMIASGPDLTVTEKKAYSIVSSPTQKGFIELMIKSENGVFAPYLLEQLKEGDNCVLIGPQGNFMKDLFENNEKFIACWSAGSGIPSSISLAQYSLDSHLDNHIVIFDSNKTQKDIIYYDRIKKLIDQSKNFRCAFTITRESKADIPKSSHSRISYSSGRFWPNEENSLQKYSDARSFIDKLLRKETNWKEYYNTICGSSSFINGKGRDKDGKLAKISQGIEDHLLKFDISSKKIDKDQYYLQ